MVDLRQAIAGWCNVYFYHVGVKLEIDRIAQYATLLGLGRPSGIDLPNEMGGLIPSTEWKRRVQNTAWYPARRSRWRSARARRWSRPCRWRASRP